MLKTFLVGLFLGIAAAAAAVVYVPVVDQHREASIVSVMPNGGNSEIFHVNVPMDRIMIGAPDRRRPMPAGLQWPELEQLAGLRSELFKIRNEQDTVIGVASRMAWSDTELGEAVEWVLHLPARGSLFVVMQGEPVDGGYRLGEIRDGSNEFHELSGSLTERWIVDTSGSEDAPAGKIELVSRFVGIEKEQ